MTEDEYRAVPKMASLPLYDEKDPRCENLTRIDDPSFDTLREANDYEDALSCVHDPTLECRGGIRYTAGDDVFVYAYFWKRRETEK